MEIILVLASLIGTALGTILLISVLVLIDVTISYVKAKTEQTNRQIEEYDFSYPKEYNNEK